MPTANSQQPTANSQQPTATNIGFSPDPIAERKAELLQLLRQTAPEVISDNQLDLERLKQLLGEDRIAPAEHYELSWAGKAAARREIQKTTSHTLLPAADNPAQAQHILIEGENLEVLRVLQKSYYGKVKMIYIDPPYNTGNDSFVYPDDYSETLDEYLRRTGEKNEAGFLNKQSLWKKNSKESGQYHSAWLSMMYPRLYLARNLLRDDGVIFISIDDNEAANLKLLCDEVFGGNNYVSSIFVEMSTTQGMKVKAAKEGNLVKNGELILVYSKNGHQTIGKIPLLKPANYDNHYSIYLKKISDGLFSEASLSDEIRSNKAIMEELIELGLVKKYQGAINFRDCYTYSPSFRRFINSNAAFIARAHDSIPISDDFASNISDSYVRRYESGSRSYLIAKSDNGSFYQRILLIDKLNYADDFYKTFGPTTIRGDWWDGFYIDMGNVNKEGGVAFNNGKKPVRLIKQLVKFTSNNLDDIILDFFAGSGTTAQAVMELNLEDGGNRQCISVQMPEFTYEIDDKTGQEKPKKGSEEAYKAGYKTIADITRARIDKVIAKLKAEQPEKTADLACANFTLAPSNFKVWRSDVPDAEAVREQLQMFQQAEKQAVDKPASQTAILSELLLKNGLGALGVHAISRPQKLSSGTTIHRVLMNDDKVLWLCFEPYAEGLKEEIVKAKPAQVILLNSCFTGDKADEQLSNLQLELIGLDIGLLVI